ncbi:uncharacterized protein C1orf146 homolog isoform X2 [Pomacea canaliculata]|uniref:uncharacterized protein C1orf146 homolog isoform X2 n=1 Tax=Pomacea canaliculata TaxID=400727 RepID=UPI000D73E37B|nr:uncharacterized protein C1orf146 homolog isoform X2 [Pomacea canaliculata]
MVIMYFLWAHELKDLLSNHILAFVESLLSFSQSVPTFPQQTRFCTDNTGGLLHTSAKNMEGVQQQERQQQPPPVIVHHSVANSPLNTCLRRYQLRIRVSERTIPGSVIFPRSGVAFFYLPLSAVPMTDIQQSGVFLRIGEFAQVHGHSYVVVVTQKLTETTMDFVEKLQAMHLSSRLQIILAHSPSDATEAMLDISKLQCPPVGTAMQLRFCRLLDRLLLEGTAQRLLSSVGLDSHQIQVVQDGIGSIAQLAAASSSDLMECALDSNTSQNVVRFFGGTSQQ